jgi:hypothetical protein
LQQQVEATSPNLFGQAGMELTPLFFSFALTAHSTRQSISTRVSQGLGNVHKRSFISESAPSCKTIQASLSVFYNGYPGVLVMDEQETKKQQRMREKINKKLIWDSSTF